MFKFYYLYMPLYLFYFFILQIDDNFKSCSEKISNAASEIWNEIQAMQTNPSAGVTFETCTCILNVFNCNVFIF